jgi:hypothetical protein
MNTVANVLLSKCNVLLRAPAHASSNSKHADFVDRPVSTLSAGLALVFA